MLDFLPRGRCVSKTTRVGTSRLFTLGQLGSLTLEDEFLDELRMRSAHLNFYGPDRLPDTLDDLYRVRS